MSESSQFDFTKFVPGFDFLKQLSQTSASLPQAHHWVAPTVDPKEIEKRIQELKTVHFWLEQNTKAVLATVQALEVQLMTINTLKGMNMSMSEMAKGLQIKPQGSAQATSTKSAGASAAKKDYFSQSAKTGASSPSSERVKQGEDTEQASDKGGDSPQAVDPMAWWGSLSQQFSQIAEQTFAEIKKTSDHVARAQGERQDQPKKASPVEKKTTQKENKAVKPAKSSGPKSAPSKAHKKASPQAQALGKASPKVVRKQSPIKANSVSKTTAAKEAKSWFSTPPVLSRGSSKSKKGV